MGNLGSILISAILSGIFATVVTLWWQSKNQAKQEKTRIFKILMSTRYDISLEESVSALNMIDVVFYKSSKVRTVWREFNEVTKQPESKTKEQLIFDKYLRLLEVIAEDIGYKQICWEDIKQYYYPVGLSNKRRDEAILRKAQIDANLAQIKREQEHSQTAQIDAQSEMNNQMVLKALENPDAFLKLFEIAEKAQTFNTGTKHRK